MLPEAAEILDVFADGFRGGALRRGAHDVTTGDLLRHRLGHELLEPRALHFVFDARRNSDALAARHVHHEPRRQSDESREPRTLGAHGILDHLHQDVVALVDQAPDVLDVLLTDQRTFRHRRSDVRGMQERGALQANIDERGLHAGQHALYPALVEIAHDAAPALPLDEQLGQHAVFDERGARLARRHVDQDFRRHSVAPANVPFQTAIPWLRSCPRRFEQRQSHDIGVTAGDFLDEHRAEPLDRIGARLALRFAAGPVGAHFERGNLPELDLGVYAAQRRKCVTDDAKSGEDVVLAARQQLQHADAVGLVPWLFEDAAVDMHGGIGRQYRQIQVQLAHRLRLVLWRAD